MWSAECTLKSETASFCQPASLLFCFGKQFHYPLHGEKACFGPKAAARPVSNSKPASTAMADGFGTSPAAVSLIGRGNPAPGRSTEGSAQASWACGMQRLVGCPSECGALFDTAAALGISLRSVTLRLRAMRLSALVARDSDADRPSRTLISTEFLLPLTFTPRSGTHWLYELSSKAAKLRRG